MTVAARTDLSATPGVAAWERIISGRRYWFNATPYDVKVFRLTLAGGDLVHHWRDVPEAVGEYNPFDPSTRPLPGQVAWSHHWDRSSAERVYHTSCRVCGDVVEVTRTQLVSPHGDRYGARTCVGSGSAATLKAALVRDAALSVGEEAAHSATVGWLYSCRGFQTLSDGSTEYCHHPICGQRLDKGMRWSLMGWTKD